MNFSEAVARSVTSHCAIFPETCSLISGCAHFFGYVRIIHHIIISYMCKSVLDNGNSNSLFTV